MWLLAELSSLRASELRASVPCWLWAGGLPQFLTMWASPQGSWLPPEQASKKARDDKKEGSLFKNLIFKVIFHHFFAAPFFF